VIPFGQTFLHPHLVVRLGFVSVPELAHALAEEPGMEPAPRTTEAEQVDEAVADWFRRHLASA